VDADRFDELAVSFVAGRRHGGRGLLAGAAGALFRGGIAEAGGDPTCAAPGEACK
jgi:hypothetical protein